MDGSTTGARVDAFESVACRSSACSGGSDHAATGSSAPHATADGRALGIAPGTGAVVRTTEAGVVVEAALAAVEVMGHPVVTTGGTAEVCFDEVFA